VEVVDSILLVALMHLLWWNTSLYEIRMNDVIINILMKYCDGFQVHRFIKWMREFQVTEDQWRAKLVLPNARAWFYSLPAIVANRRLFRKLFYQGIPTTLIFSLISSDFNVFCWSVIALNYFIAYNSCHIVRRFRLKFILIKVFITIITKHVACHCVRFSD